MSMPSVLCRREGESRQTVIVALEGDKASTERTGVAPLSKALHELVGPTDELLVLAILNIKPEVLPILPITDYSSCEECPYIRSLLQEVSQRKEHYRHIFRPFYDRCKSSEVKFELKVSAGCQPRDIILEQANNTKATWIVIDRCFARDMSPGSSDTDCNIYLVGEDEEAMILKYLARNDGSGTSAVDQVISNPEPSDLTKELQSQEEPQLCSSPNVGAEFQPFSPSVPESMSRERENLTMSEPYQASENIEEPQLCSSPNVGAEFQPFSPSVPESMSRERENPTMSEPYQASENIEGLETPTEGALVHDESISSQRLCDVMQIRPLQLSEEIVAAITGGFMTKIGTNRQENSETYTGFVADNRYQIMVKRFKGDSGVILEAEKKAALYMYHNNILGLRGYHRSENTTVLVFPFARGRTLDNYLYGSRGKEVDLAFLDKMKIAIGIAKGIRYMHEECPRGPIAHGDLQPHNIILGHDLKPQISGFGRATWLHLEQPLQFTNKRCPDKDPSDNPSMILVKSDILSFGVLLLRLFCRKQMPQDDKKLIKWARPLLLERAFHELLGEDTLDLDMYGLYKVMTAATQCTKTRPSSRPCMSEVISILRGESSCAVQCSPSTESSNM